jgi:hypothetical protein
MLAFVALLFFVFLALALPRAKRIAIGGGQAFLFEAKEKKSDLIGVKKK